MSDSVSIVRLGNRLDEPIFVAAPKPMLTEFGILYRLESCEAGFKIRQN